MGVLFAAMVTSVVIARSEGPRGTGTFALVYTLVDVTVMVAGLGLSQGITYALSHRLWSLRTALRISGVAVLVLGTAGGLLALLAYTVGGDSFLDGLTSTMVLLTVASIPFAMAAAFASAIALARDRYEVYTGIQLGQAFLGLVAIVALVIPFGIVGAVAGFAASYVVVGLVATAWAWRFGARATGEEEQGTSVRSMVSFGLQAWTGNLLQYLNYRVDLFILNAYTSRADVGIYSLAVSLTTLGWVLPNALHTVLFPRTASEAASANAGEISPDDADAAITRPSRHIVILMLPTALLLVLLLVVGVPLLYGEEFQDTVMLGLLLLPGVLVLGFGKVLTAATSGRGYPKYTLLTVAIVAPITLVLYFVLVPAMGATGAALSSTISYALTTLLSLVFLRRVTGIGLRALAVPSRGDLDDYVHALRMVARLPAVQRFRGR